MKMSLNLDLSDGDVEIYLEKCDSIIEWAEQNPRRNFDTQFIEDLIVTVTTRDRITENQKAAVDRIISAFEIE